MKTPDYCWIRRQQNPRTAIGCNMCAKALHLVPQSEQCTALTTASIETFELGARLKGLDPDEAEQILHDEVYEPAPRISNVCMDCITSGRSGRGGRDCAEFTAARLALDTSTGLLLEKPIADDGSFEAYDMIRAHRDALSSANHAVHDALTTLSEKVGRAISNGEECQP